MRKRSVTSLWREVGLLATDSAVRDPGGPSNLRRVRRNGYALVEGEYEDGISAVAAAIGNERFGRVVGTVALSAPATRVGRRELAALAPAVRRTAGRLETLWPLACRRSRGSPSEI